MYSTPSGSTAYNKALGGAIIHPSIEAIQIAEMASINNRVFRTVGSPLVLPKHHTCVEADCRNELTNYGGPFNDGSSRCEINSVSRGKRESTICSFPSISVLETSS